MVIDLARVIQQGGSTERTEVMSSSTLTAGSIATMTAADLSCPPSPAPLASTAGETDSIVSADRNSLTSSSTFRRVGSGTSASTMLNRVRTPLQKRRFFSNTASVDVKEEEKREELTTTNLQPVLVKLNHFFKHDSEKFGDEEILRALAEARKTGSSRFSRMKTFPGELSLELSGAVADDLPAR